MSPKSLNTVIVVFRESQQQERVCGLWGVNMKWLFSAMAQSADAGRRLPLPEGIPVIAIFCDKRGHPSIWNLIFNAKAQNI